MGKLIERTSSRLQAVARPRPGCSPWCRRRPSARRQSQFSPGSWCASSPNPDAGHAVEQIQHLAATPVLLMDEPFAAVDPIVRARLQDEFLRLQGELGKTVVLVTHDIDEAVKMGDKVAILAEGGRLTQFGTPGRAPRPPGRRLRGRLRRVHAPGCAG